jgi:hypothetical protein
MRSSVVWASSCEERDPTTASRSVDGSVRHVTASAWSSFWRGGTTVRPDAERSLCDDQEVRIGLAGRTMFSPGSAGRQSASKNQ